MKEIELNELLDNSSSGILRITRFKYIPSSIYRRQGKDGYTYLCTNTPYVSLLYKYNDKERFYYGKIISNGEVIYTIRTAQSKNILMGLMKYIDSFNYNVSINILDEYTVVAQKYIPDTHHLKSEYFSFK